MDNNFTISFGQQPSSYIERHDIANQIYEDFSLDFPVSHIYIISGVRGSGKTVLLTNVADKIKKNEDWIVVDVNPNREMLEQIAAQIYENASVKHLFLSKSFSISFHGFGFSIEGKEPVSNVKTVLEKMLTLVQKQGKKVLITVDEASNNTHMRAFAHDFQSLLRDNYPIFTLMTGLYENVNSLQNNKNLTFLYRATKVELKPLDLDLVEKEYSKIFKASPKQTIEKLAQLTNGYAFAYQVVGFLYSKYNDIEKIIPEFDRYLSSYVYDKIWEALPTKEKDVLFAFKSNVATVADLQKITGYINREFSVYRDRLIKRGLIASSSYGELSLILPRFYEYIQKQI